MATGLFTAHIVFGRGIPATVVPPSVLTRVCLSGEFDRFEALAGEYNLAAALAGELNLIAALAGEYNRVVTLSGEVDTYCETA